MANGPQSHGLQKEQVAHTVLVAQSTLAKHRIWQEQTTEQMAWKRPAASKQPSISEHLLARPTASRRHNRMAPTTKVVFWQKKSQPEGL
jgi:hypothetical protein